MIYELQPSGDGTDVTLTQDNIENEDQKKHMEQNWNKVLEGMKKLVEQ